MLQHHLGLRVTVGHVPHGPALLVEALAERVARVVRPHEELFVPALSEHIEHAVIVSPIGRAEVDGLEAEDANECRLDALKLWGFSEARAGVRWGGEALVNKVKEAPLLTLVDLPILQRGQVLVGPRVRTERVALRVQVTHDLSAVVDAAIVVALRVSARPSLSPSVAIVAHSIHNAPLLTHIQEKGALAADAVERIGNVVFVLKHTVCKCQLVYHMTLSFAESSVRLHPASRLTVICQSDLAFVVAVVDDLQSALACCGCSEGQGGSEGGEEREEGCEHCE